MTRTQPDKVRLQKFLADAGVASRRRCEELILEGRVLVNGVVIEELPAFVDPRTDRVVANGTPVKRQKLDYFLVHKPKGVVCTNRDPQGRTRAIDLLPELSARLFPVGRLDADSTGLLLMTNDGELAEHLTHPRYGVPKCYRAEVRGRVPGDLPEILKAGVYLSEGKARATEVEVVHASYDRSVLMITLREGRNRQVRRMLARVGHRVKTLKRVQIGPLTVRRLPVGAARRLTPRELDQLRDAVEQARAAAESPDRRRRPTTRKRKQKKPTPKRSGGATRKPHADDDRPTRRLIT